MAIAGGYVDDHLPVQRLHEPGGELPWLRGATPHATPIAKRVHLGVGRGGEEGRRDERRRGRRRE